jgi:general secretion pathway protein D
LIPDAPISAELRAATTERYALASVEAAKILSRGGDVAGAKELVDKVLAPSVAPNHPGAVSYRAQLDDPIRTNPALTKEHAKNVDSVRKLLYTAEGAYNLGKYDEADSRYKDVLRIDPNNSAARRGMEQVATAKSRYQQSSFDQARSEMLGAVDGAWEMPVAPAAIDPTLTNPADSSADLSFVSVKNKIDRIIIPKISLEQTSLDEAIEFLRVRAREHDTINQQGVNFAVNLGTDPATADKIRKIRFDLRLSNVPVSQVLKYITAITQTSFSTDDHSVIIRSASSASSELVLKTYRVPPDFISSINEGITAAAATDDPFGEAPSGGGLLAQRLGVQEALTKQGVAFPEGASASYIANANLLRVINTDINQDYIGQIIETLTKTEPVMVSVAVTMIKVSQTNLKELGYDWLLNPVPLDSAGKVFGSGGTVGNTPGRTGADFISPVNGTSVDSVPANPDGTVDQGVMTNGNRSGDSAINQNSIDNLIANPNRSAQRLSAAPGVLAVTGLFTDGQVQGIMRGLQQKKGVDLMARPATVTRSGQSSSIAIVREMLYPTEFEPPELPNSTGGDINNGIFGGGGGGSTPVTPATPTAFEKKDVGISMEVLPVADPSKQFVTVTLSPTFSDFDGFVNYGSPINSTQTDALGNQASVTVTSNEILQPIFSKQAFSTTVDVMDGATMVVGGLMQDEVQDVEDKTPIFGSIPILGRLFQTKARQSTSTAIIFMINVELMDPTGRRYRDR